MGSESPNSSTISRRGVLKGGALAAVTGVSGLGINRSVNARPAKSHSTNKDPVRAGSNVAIAETKAGKIAGYLGGGIYAFKGVPYAASPEGANRFLPARKPTPWTGVRSSRQFGVICPQDKGNGRLHDEEAFIFRWNDSVEGEDCLRVNVWTPGLRDNGRRPVMVWLHGGGFEAGSGHDLPAFDGENLARRGDVVVVTLNHRLNLLGYLDLSAYGEQYASSGNIGMLDIVTALEWVRDNIAEFGGDPRRVLIFGQSGGGAKVGTLMGMPAARGLFHRAIVESGSFTLTSTRDKSQKLAALLLAELGLGPGDVRKLHELPYAELQRAGAAAMLKANGPFDIINFKTLQKRLIYGPVVDGHVLPELPFGEAAPAISADVPMMVGTTLNELVTATDHPEYERMTRAELAAKVDVLFPSRATEIISVFEQRAPGAKPFDLWSRIAASPIREAAIRQAKLKAAQNAASAYLYWFTWQTPIFDGRPGAFHCAEIPFAFANAEQCDYWTGGGPRAKALGDRVADAWIHFARKGNPSHPGIPAWAPFSPQAAPSMIFDDEVRLELNPDGAEQAVIKSG